jgi:hypothetical protein
VTAILGFLGGLLKLVGGAIPALLAYYAGRSAVKRTDAEATLEVKNAQLDIASKPILHRSILLDRMLGRKRRSN